MSTEKARMDGNAFIPIPLIPLSRKLHRERKMLRAVVDKLIEDYVKESGKGFLKLNDLINRLTEADTDAYSISDKEKKGLLEEIESELKKIDSRFKPVYEFIKDMDWNEQKRLFVDNFETLSIQLRAMRKTLLSELKSSGELTKNDFLIHSYVSHFTSLIERVSDELEDSHKDDIEAIIRAANVIVILYGPVITSYFTGKLKNGVLSMRLGELASFSEPMYVKRNRRLTEALESVESVAPISTEG